jgi:hypothetical protein
MRRLILHPLLMAAFPVLFLYAHNIHQTQPVEMAIPLAASVALGLLIWGILTPLFGNLRSAALAATWFLLLFHTYGHVFHLVKGLSLGPFVLGRGRFLMPLWILAFAGGSWLLFRIRGKKPSENLAYLANIFTLCMVGLSLIQIAQTQIRRGFAPGGEPTPAPEAAPAGGLPGLQGNAGSGAAAAPAVNASATSSVGYLPDIYYIIPDSYIADASLKEFYGYDNRPFTGFLEEKGFRIGSHSVSNYAFTWLSLSSSLNMQYMNFLAETLGSESLDNTIAGRMLTDNKVMAFLKARGYTIINSGSWWGPTRRNRNADVNLLSGFHNEFTLQFLECTFLHPFTKYFIEDDLREKVLYTFEQLGEIPLMEAPTFTLAHVICPHSPFIFGANGEKLSTLRKVQAKTNPRKHYLDQVLFVNKKLKEAVERILARSARPPIIIIQGDHGAAYVRGTTGRSESVPDDGFLREQMRILNAYYLPGVPPETVYDAITPVNTFRAVFNAYFGAGLPVLADESWYSTKYRPYGFVHVTDKVKYPK